MTFQEYLDNAWNIHDPQADKLLNEFANHFSLFTSQDDIFSLAHLIMHVSGEHLGKWNEGIKLLQELKKNPLVQDQLPLDRFIAILSLGNNPHFDFSHFNLENQTRILSVTASALASQNDIARSGEYMNRAHALAMKLPKENPAIRVMAASGNNLACALEEKETRTPAEVELMLEAAKTARKFWEIAGTWLEVERAEYRLAQSFMKAGRLDQALHHAATCLEIVQDNGNTPMEVFFGYEVLGLVEKARGNQIGYNKSKERMTETFALLSADDQSWCKKILEKF